MNTRQRRMAQRSHKATTNKGLIRLAAITILVLSLLAMKAQVNTESYNALQAHNQVTEATQ